MNLVLIQDGYLPAVVPPILRMDYVSLLEQAPFPEEAQGVLQ